MNEQASLPTFWYPEAEYERVLNLLIAERADHARHRREDAEEIKAWQAVAKHFEAEWAKSCELQR